MDALLSGHEVEFLIKIGLCLLFGTMIGVERELRGKPAGISTNCFVMAGACLFTFVSQAIDPHSPARIAAQIVSGVGFIGAGMIIKSDGSTVRNLTTAAAIWFAAAIGMVIGYGWYVIAGIATIYAVLVPRIPHVKNFVSSDE
jgi:putative Mg2+ transporter-C (MgtC) family protein